MVSIWFSFALDVSAFLALFFFFFKYQRLLHCSWDMNSASRQMNNNLCMNSNFFIFIFLLFSVFNFQQNKSSQLMFSLRPYLSQHKNHLKVIVNLYSWYNQDKNSSIYRWNCMPCSNISSHRACLYNMHYWYRPWENQSTYQFIWFIQWA